MNLPRSSILRLMASVALIALALALLRARNETRFWLGELAPLSAIGLFGLAMMLATCGRRRRFFAGLAATGVVIGLIFWIGPYSFRAFVSERVLMPIEARFSPSPANNVTEMQALNYLAFYDVEARGIGLIRSPFYTVEAQAKLGCLELALAVIGGLLAAIPGPRKARPSVTTDS